MEELLTIYRAYVQYSVIICLAAYAWWRGGPPEKACGCLMAGSVTLTFCYFTFLPEQFTRVFDGVNFGILFIDAAELCGYVFVAMRANRIYPLWLLGSQIMALGNHLIRGLDVEIGPMGYYLILIAPSYMQIIILSVGIYAHRRRIKRYGPYPAWRMHAGD